MKIEGKGIYKKYRAGKRNVLSDVSFCAKEGECVGILGANGCGKTTLLSILAGIQKADQGEFLVDGKNILKNRKLINQRIGYVPQGNPLMEELTARDNLKLWYCDSVLDMKTELNSGVLKMLGIDEFLHVRVSRMSGGMKKRLSIGCAVANRPDILILDEPGASLDLVCKHQIDEYLRHFQSQGGIILLATHEEREIDLCDKIYLLKNGSLKEYVYTDVQELVKQLSAEG